MKKIRKYLLPIVCAIACMFTTFASCGGNSEKTIASAQTILIHFLKIILHPPFLVGTYVIADQPKTEYKNRKMQKRKCGTDIGAAFCFVQSVTVNVIRLSPEVATLTCPRCASATDLTTARPIPCPPAALLRALSGR